MIDRPRRDNSAADFLSRMNIALEVAPVPVPDDFPDENLFVISTHTPWFSNVTNYMVSGSFPQNLSTREKHNIVQRSANYSWIEGTCTTQGLI